MAWSKREKAEWAVRQILPEQLCDSTDLPRCLSIAAEKLFVYEIDSPRAAEIIRKSLKELGERGFLGD